MNGMATAHLIEETPKSPLSGGLAISFLKRISSDYMRIGIYKMGFANLIYSGLTLMFRHQIFPP